MSVLPATPATTSTPSAAPRARRRWYVAYGLYTAASNATFSQAIWVIYLATHGYSPFAIGLFEMGFHIAKFIAEAPTGVFADLVGRRASLIVSSILGAVASLLYLVPIAPLIALDFALQGVAYAFRGGADSALLWTLVAPDQDAAAPPTETGAPLIATSRPSRDEGAAARYSRLFSRMFLVTLFAQTLGVASGGLLSALNPVLPFLCAGLSLLLAILPLLMLPSGKAAPTPTPHRHPPKPLAHFSQALRAAWRDPVLLGLLGISALEAAVITTTGYYTQLYFHGLGFSPVVIGLIFACTIVPDALCAAAAPRIQRMLPARWVLSIFLGAMALGLLAMSTAIPALGLVGFLVLLHAGDSVLYPSLNRYLNERAPEEQRATVLSLDATLFSAMMIVLFPAFGLGLTHVSFGTAYFGTFVALIAGCAAIGGGVTMLLRRRNLVPPKE
ncbi:MAG TPA: MFS transporter [Ktedonobacterales bacterium]|nr:MFS transporter [Ktedonobacterales bacterium]